jgi:hypothetical protein
MIFRINFADFGTARGIKISLKREACYKFDGLKRFCLFGDHLRVKRVDAGL